MTKIELLDYLIGRAKAYRSECEKSIKRNNHMNEIVSEDPIDQRVVDAILVDFINSIGVHQGIDLGLYTIDLTKPKSTDN